MNTLKLSNVQLAKYLHLDPSLISRYRNGMRIPSEGHDFVEAVAHCLATRLQHDIHGQRQLELVLQLLPDDKQQAKANLREAIAAWLTGEPEAHGVVDVEKLLDRVDGMKLMLERVAMNPNPSPSAPSLDSLVDISSLRRQETFYGIDGLRAAALRFLALAASLPEAKILYLYSDQPMDWLSHDPNYALRWNFLMQMVLRKGHRIEIIHNLDRDSGEIYDAIRKWLPLYMNGQISSYYHSSAKDDRFCRTLFIIPNEAVVHSSFVAGTQDQAIYNFFVKKEDVRCYLKQFQAMLSHCKTFVTTIPLRGDDAFHSLLESLACRDQNILSLAVGRPMASLTEGTLGKAMANTSLDAKTQTQMLATWERSKDLFHKHTQQHQVTNLLSLPDSAATEIATAFPGLCYDRNCFLEHLEASILTLETNPNYHLHLLPEQPFHSTSISLCQQNCCMIFHREMPLLAFRFEHPLMYTHFSAWLNALDSRIPPCNKDKGMVIQTLRQLARKLGSLIDQPLPGSDH